MSLDEIKDIMSRNWTNKKKLQRIQIEVDRGIPDRGHIQIIGDPWNLRGIWIYNGDQKLHLELTGGADRKKTVEDLIKIFEIEKKTEVI